MGNLFYCLASIFRWANYLPLSTGANNEKSNKTMSLIVACVCNFYTYYHNDNCVNIYRQHNIGSRLLNVVLPLVFLSDRICEDSGEEFVFSYYSWKRFTIFIVSWGNRYKVDETLIRFPLHVNCTTQRIQKRQK